MEKLTKDIMQYYNFEVIYHKYSRGYISRCNPPNEIYCCADGRLYHEVPCFHTTQYFRRAYYRKPFLQIKGLINSKRFQTINFYMSADYILVYFYRTSHISDIWQIISKDYLHEFIFNLVAESTWNEKYYVNRHLLYLDNIDQL